MTHLRVTLLGSFQAALSGVQVHFRSDKVRALLAYLAVEAARPHTRASLCGMLWPNQSDAAALHNLSQTLLRLREALGDTRISAAFLNVSRPAIQWSRASESELDVSAFVRLASSSQIGDLEQAAALYQGEFLAGFALPGCPAFEEWQLLTRERMAQLAVTVLGTLGDLQLTAGRYGEAELHARRSIALDPWREAGHRQLMRALAGQGNRAAAMAAYDHCRQLLRDSLGVEPDAEAQALYQQIRTEMSGRHAPGETVGEAASPSAHLPGSRMSMEEPLAQPEPWPAQVAESQVAGGNLPALLTPLIGRERDLMALTALLQRRDVRLVTLIGLGGMGKTRLALALAEARRHAYADGVAVAALARLNDPTALPTAITQALGLTLQSEHALTALVDWLRERELLLVLDNFEHLLGGAKLLATLLQAAPRLTIVVTSREPLNLLGEHTYLVGGLAYLPKASEVTNIDMPAVRLFAACATRRWPDFALDARNLPAVLRICRLVQGMPLGIELAAAWVESLSPDEIATEIAQSQTFLTGEWQNLPERQRSLHTIFEMTWQRMSEDEREACAQLALFRGGFTREAARAVTGAMARTLNRLVQKSLLRVSQPLDGGRRYELHELLRQFAETQLAATLDQGEGARRRYAAYFTAFAEEAELHLEAADQVEWLDRLEAEHDNLRAVLGRAVSSGDTIAGLKLAGALGGFWWPRGYLGEGRRWLDVLLAVPALGVTRGLTAAEVPEAVKPIVAKALACAGELAYGQGSHAPATELLQRSLEYYRQIADRRGQARVLRGLGNVLVVGGDEERASELRAESLALYQAVGDQLGVAWMLLEIGRSACEPARQVALLEESLALARAGGYPRTIATALGNLGKLARDRGEHKLAEQHLREVLRIGYELRDTWLQASTLGELGILATQQRAWGQAQALLEESLALFRQDSNERGVALVEGHLIAMRLSAVQFVNADAEPHTT